MFLSPRVIYVTSAVLLGLNAEINIEDVQFVSCIKAACSWIKQRKRSMHHKK